MFYHFLSPKSKLILINIFDGASGRLVSSSRRRRSEFWLSGNDIDEEGVWEWARTRTTVPEFGWTEEPFDSPEENCLAWTITAERRGSSDGWHPSSCCNSLQYICELWDCWHTSSCCCNSLQYICELWDCWHPSSCCNSLQYICELWDGWQSSSCCCNSLQYICEIWSGWQPLSCLPSFQYICELWDGIIPLLVMQQSPVYLWALRRCRAKNSLARQFCKKL